MDDYLIRLFKEAGELKDKLNKLREFNQSKNIRNLSKKQQKLLREQEDVMHRYHEILETRIAST